MSDDFYNIECPECGGSGILEDECECLSVVDICCCLVPTPPTCPECRGRGIVR